MNKILLIISFVLVLVGSALAEPTEMRAWTSMSGTQVNARGISLMDNYLVLEKEDGARITINIKRLSQADQDYADHHFQQKASRAASWRSEAKSIAEEYGVRVVFDEMEFPSYWKEWNPKWVIAPEEARMGALQKLRIDLSHYSPEFIRKHLDRIYLFTELTFRGQIYGGTNDHKHKWLYLHIQWLGDNGTHAKAMGFHHEFSSILLKLYKDKFKETTWRQVNPQTFRYAFEQSLETNIQAGKTDLIGNADLYNQGFLCSYGQLTLEDDFNTFAQYLIAKPGLLKSYMARYPKIHTKANLLTEFMQAIGYSRPNR